MATRNTILVTGATGRQGGAVARCLLEKGEKIRIMTRFPEKAREWTGSAEVVRGDFDDYQSLQKAVQGARGVFLVGNPYEAGPDGEAEQGKTMVYACREEGVPHIVYSSAYGANRDSAVPQFDSKFEVEEYLKESGIAHTILRPVSFMENFESSGVRRLLEDGVVSLPLSAETKLQLVSVGDIGKFAAEALCSPKVFGGKEIDLAGDERRIGDAVAEISCTMNRPIRYERMRNDEAERSLGYDVTAMYIWIEEVGQAVDIEELKALYRIPLTPFSRYLGKSGLFSRAA